MQVRKLVGRLINYNNEITLNLLLPEQSLDGGT